MVQTYTELNFAQNRLKKKKRTAGVLWVIKDKADAFYSLSLLTPRRKPFFSLEWNEIIFRHVK